VVFPITQALAGRDAYATDYFPKEIARDNICMDVKRNQTDLFAVVDTPKPLKCHGEIHIGTSGYIFRDWQGLFYPAGLPKNQWLEYYARHFTVVEINATYYRILPASSFEGMINKTPDSFGFWVKVPSDVTHGSEDPRPALKLFLESLHPLIESNRLCGVLAQFPPSFKYSRTGLDHIVWILDTIGNILLAVEFRSDDWFNDDVYTFFNENGLILVAVDLPKLSGLPKIEIQNTGPVAYTRFHGRNRKTWYNRQAGDRYDYEYTDDELKSWLPHISRMDEHAPLTYLFFNNCHAGQAVKNARMMRQILEMEFEAPF